MTLIILFTLIHLLSYSYRYSEIDQKIGLKAFGYIFLIGYIGFTISQLDFYFFHVKIEEFDPLILLIINICLVLWLHLYYLNYQRNIINSGDYMIFVRNFIEKFGISKRETEIIELIIKGKTNKEIEDILYISFNTVKNHIYNIYKKTGVNSRIKLLQIIKKQSGNIN
jgi:DNA-binding CsgD family transcriptional regulator